MANLLRCRTKSGLTRSSSQGQIGALVREAEVLVRHLRVSLPSNVRHDEGAASLPKNAAASDTSFEHRSSRKVRSVATGWIRT